MGLQSSDTTEQLNPTEVRTSAGTVDKNSPASAAGMGSTSGPGNFQMPKVYEIFKELNNKTSVF